MSRPQVGPKLVRLLLIAVIGGAVVAGAALPATALATWAINHAGMDYEDLPAVLRDPTISQSSYLYASDGQTLITTFFDENRQDVALEQVAPAMREAVIAAEDVRFYEHNGVDLKGVIRAALANSSSGDVQQGASTLTMQYVRNVLKSDPTRTAEERAAATATTAGRKIQEARYALTLEQHLTKDQILERYLNIAYFGNGAYGVSAASHTYFSKAPSELSLAEAALLAGLVQNPPESTLDTAKVTARRGYVLGSMATQGMITSEQAAEAQALPIELHKGTTPNDCVASASGFGYFCDYFRQWWQEQPAFGETVAERQRALRQGGYRIVTTLDPAIQAAAQDQVLSVYDYDSKFVAPMAVVEPGTGKVLAMAVNKHYSNAGGVGDSSNQLIAGGPGMSGYQAGSTFKLFTMLAALNEGLQLDTSFDAPTRLVTKWPEPRTVDGKANPVSCDGYWCPGNANPSWMDGWRDMWSGFGRSVNTYFVWLEQQVGPDKVVDMARNLGIKIGDGDLEQHKDLSDWGSFTLGVSSTTPLDLANAYATVAAEGVYCNPLPVASVSNSAGVLPDVARSACRQAVSPDVARAAADAARCPVGQSGTLGECDGGTASAVSGILRNRPVAGKTGSSTDNNTESFAAFTPQLAAAMIAANPKEPNDGVGAAALSKVYTAVARTMASALDGQPVEKFTAPTRSLAYGSRFAYVPPPTPITPPTPTAPTTPDDRPNGRGSGHGSTGTGSTGNGSTDNGTTSNG